MTARPGPLAPPHRPLAWIGAGAPASGLASAALQCFDDSDDFLLAPEPYGFDFYVVQLAQRGVRGVDLVRLIRRRSAAGILALCNERQDELVAAYEAGADLVMSQQAPAEHLRAAMVAVQRRMQLQAKSAVVASEAWRLLADSATLQAPDGTRIPLSDSDLAIMLCFARADGGRVERRQLVECLWGEPSDAMDNALHATLYRLRKRIELASHALAPVRAVAKVGYEFRAPLELA